MGPLYPRDFGSASAFGGFRSTVSFRVFSLKFYVSWQPWTASPCRPGGEHPCRNAPHHASEAVHQLLGFLLSQSGVLESVKVCFLFWNSITNGSSRMRGAVHQLTNPQECFTAQLRGVQCLWSFGSFPTFGDFCSSPHGSILAAHIPGASLWFLRAF